MLGEWPLVGRDDEFATVLDGTAAEPPASFVLAGEPGVGKSRLMAEVVSRRQTDGWLTMVALATRSATTIPFGALGHLLPPAKAWTGGAGAIIPAADELIARAGQRRLLVAVDDAHALDDASAALVHRLATSGEVAVLVATRPAEQLPDSVLALWKDGLARRLDLEPLGARNMERLVDVVLGEHVDGATRAELARISAGNPLFLRELIHAGQRAGTLRREGAVWRLRGQLGAAGGLTDLIATRLRELNEAEYSALEHVALSEPLSVELAESLIGVDVLVALERRGLVSATTDGRRTTLCMSHPLYGEVIRASLPVLRTRAIRRGFALALEATGLRRSDDMLRLATWRMQGGLPPHVPALLPAAQRARAIGDMGLAERLARAAVDAGGGFPAALAMGKAIIRQGRVAEGETLFAAAEPANDADMVRLAVIRATNLFWGLARADDADAVIEAAEGLATQPAMRDALTVTRSFFLVTAGRPRRAVELTDAVIARSDAGLPTPLPALLANAEAWTLLGRADNACCALDRASRQDDGTMHSRIQEMRWSALISSGSVNDARALAEREYQHALDDRSDSERGIWAYYRGLGMVHEGRVRTAARWLAEAVPLLREQDSFRTVPCLGALGIATAMNGDRDTARRAIEQTESHPTSALPVYLADIALARMWLAVADGTSAAARDIGLDAVERLGSEVPRLEVLILHTVARLGDPAAVVDRLEDLARRTDGVQYSLCAAHARAMVRDDGNELDRIAAGFNEAGLVLAAAEAAAGSALAHERAGLRARAAASSRMAMGYASRCEGASTPAIAALHRPRRLTGREQEIANLAVQGLSSREIAEQIDVSVRTVDNHLYRLYTKLGISGRHDLGSVLQTAPTRPE